MKLKLAGVTKSFVSLRGKTVAVGGIDLEIGDKEFFVLLGPSGCGKSTMLNLIAGLEKPTSGDIRFDDRLVASPERKIFLPPKERNVAMVFQNYALYPHLNVFDNIAFPLRIARRKKLEIKAAVEKTATILEIEKLLNAKPGELSGGQRQRVAIARAIVRKPNIFLLDEPLSNLDAQLRLSTRAELKSLQRRLMITTVYVTHDQTEAMTLGDRIAVMKDGRLEQVGTPEELYHRPANPFVAAFIGSPPMNLISATLVEDGGNYFFDLSGPRLRVPNSMLPGILKSERESFILGVRPEDIRIVTDESEAMLGGIIVAEEVLGREQLFHFACGEIRMVILSTATRHNSGDSVQVRIDMNRLHLFEA
jgi:multiple sugar transport system ATP-binding protein